MKWQKNIVLIYLRIPEIGNHVEGVTDHLVLLVPPDVVDDGDFPLPGHLPLR